MVGDTPPGVGCVVVSLFTILFVNKQNILVQLQPLMFAIHSLSLSSVLSSYFLWVGFLYLILSYNYL